MRFSNKINQESQVFVMNLESENQNDSQKELNKEEQMTSGRGKVSENNECQRPNGMAESLRS